MAKNDVVLIDGVIADRLLNRIPSDKKDEVFEYFCFEQLLKEFAPSKEEIESGWVDGRDDGGIDGFFTIINGSLLQDANAFTWPKKNAEIEVHIVTCKHHDTFEQAPLNLMAASVGEILNLSADEGLLRAKYGTDVANARQRLLSAYVRLSTARPTLRFHFYYTSRGDTALVAGNIRARAEQIVETTEALFSECKASFHFFGASELFAAYRRVRSFTFDLRALELMTTGPGNYVGIIRLGDYKELVTDETGSLRRYLFESNVRDYLGENRVNADIAESLADPNAPEFWWLNNGITILATHATSAGKVLTLHDIQIVNGLQTTESIFRHFHNGALTSIDRGVLLKVVVSNNLEIRDKIIRATNNQSLVEAASLHATDKVQRDIEEILERHDWYYERRKNYYRNIGKPAVRFVTPLYIAGGYISFVMKNPGFAARLKSRFMRTQTGYDSVFSPNAPLGVWVAIVEVLKRVEDVLARMRSTRPAQSDRFLASWRNLVGLLVVSRLLGSFDFSVHDLIGLRPNAVTEELGEETWLLVEANRGPLHETKTFREETSSKRAAQIWPPPSELQELSGSDVKAPPARPAHSLGETPSTSLKSLSKRCTLPCRNNLGSPVFTSTL